MQTQFTEEQLKDPGVARANEILRACVHCGFCTATCPTYQVLGDELDSPRGRIYLIKDMLEKGRAADADTVRHIDRCLSCLACMSTCPSGVHYMHLVDHAREHIEKTYRRPAADRALRWLLARILPYPGRFRLAMLGAMLAKPFARLLPGKLSAMVAFAPRTLPPPSRMETPQTHAPAAPRRMRVALMTGCAQRALNTDINEATIRLLTRLGVEVVIPKGEGCCGALTHHMGKTDESHAAAARNIDAWVREMDGPGLDAIVINTSGCGTTVKDYGHMFRTDPEWAEKAARVSAIARDVSEVLIELGVEPTGAAPPLAVTYHSACSLQHGQQIKTHPVTLLKQAGFEVKQPAEAHLCCGSAGTYNLMQPEISARLKARKAERLAATRPDVVAAGNIGCMMQIGSAMDVPVVHTVELLDWATGGPQPRALRADPLAAAGQAAHSRRFHWFSRDARISCGAMLRAPSLFPCPVPPTAGAAGPSAAVPGRMRAVDVNLSLLAGLVGLFSAVAPIVATPGSAAPAERRFVTDQEAARWAGVGLLSRADGVSCTAVLIRPDVALTAAHCVADADARTVVEARDLTFGAGVRDGRAVEIAPARSVEVHPGYFVAADRYDERRVRVDIARVALASPIRSAPSYRVAGTPPAGDDVALLSYARGRVGRVSIQHPCRILGRETEFLLLDCLSESGASGSPYFVIGRDGEPTVVGINSGRRMRGDRVYALALAFAHVRDFIGPSGGPPVAGADPAPEAGANASRTTAVRSRPRTEAGGAPRLPGGVKAGAGLKGLNR